MSDDRPTDERIREGSAARRERERLALRRTILDAARELFGESGYEAFSLRRLAERIGYSPTTVYLHFDNRDALLLEVCHEGFQAFGRDLQAAYASTDDPVERLWALGRAYIHFGIANPSYYRLMFMQRPDYLVTPLGEEKRVGIDTLALLSRAVQELLDSGIVAPHDPYVLTHTLWAGVHGIVALVLADPDYDPATALARADAIADIYQPAILRGLQRPRQGDG